MRTVEDAGNRKRCRCPAEGWNWRVASSAYRARLDGVPGDAGIDDLGRKGHAVGHEQLEPHEVEPGDELGDGVFDLEPGVDLQEGEASVGEEQELDRAGVDVADGARRRDRGRPQLGPLLPA